MTAMTPEFSAELKEAARLEDFVAVTATDHPELIRALEDLRAGKTIADEIESENKANRDFIVKYMRDNLHARKVKIDGQVVASLAEPETTKINWALLERLAPKALERSRYKESHERLSLGRIKN